MPTESNNREQQWIQKGDTAKWDGREGEGVQDACCCNHCVVLWVCVVLLLIICARPSCFLGGRRLSGHAAHNGIAAGVFGWHGEVRRSSALLNEAKR